MINRPCFIDLYYRDDVVDAPGHPLSGFDDVKAQGIFVLGHKVSEGTNFADPRYAARRKAWMTGAAVPVTDTNGTKLALPPRLVPYHFLHGADPVAEAKWFVARMEYQRGDQPCCDWERLGASGAAASADQAHAFCSEVEDATGVPIAVYGGDVPDEKLSKTDARWKLRLPWVCRYGAVVMPFPCQFAAPIWAWQDDGDRYGPGPHAIKGISGYCDNSTVVSPMTIARFNALLGGAAPVPVASDAPLVAPAPSAAPTPPVPGPRPAPISRAPAAVPGEWNTGVTTTSFSGTGDREVSAYGGLVDPSRPGASLPYRFKFSPRPSVVARDPETGRQVTCAIVDVGPHHVDDDYWTHGERPRAEREGGNHAGLDMTPAAWTAIGLGRGHPRYGLAKLDWRFA